MVRMELLWLPLVLALALSLALLTWIWRLRRREAGLRQELSALREREREDRLRLNTLRDLNHQMAQAADERELAQAALTAVKRLTGGLGASYTPLDLWGQPLPGLSFGDLPEPVLDGWAEHLLSERVRQRCAACTALHAGPTQECPLHGSPAGQAMQIYCLPVGLGEVRLGMVNLYLPPERPLAEEQRQFLSGLMDQMGLAIQSARARAEELHTLRELHRLRAQRLDLELALRKILSGALRASGLRGAWIQARPMADERLSGLEAEAGEIPAERSAAITEDVRMALEQGAAQEGAEGPLAWRVYPLLLPDGQAMGTLTTFWPGADARLAPFQPGLQTAAAQAALMIDYERALLSMEYRMVIQERNRLAREIHDGLAQTLAYLKLQTAQMQTALQQSDQARLNRLIQESRQALADAYQDTRTTIDALRANADQNLTDWLRKTALEFENRTGVAVELMLSEPDLVLLPEIQAQLVRFIQEALNNVRKHAQASRVCVSLRRWNQDLLLELSDDGLGFDPEDVPDVTRYGLRGMQERAYLIGAEFQIISQPRQGTTVRLSLPGQFQEASQ